MQATTVVRRLYGWVVVNDQGVENLVAIPDPGGSGGYVPLIATSIDSARAMAGAALFTAKSFGRPIRLMPFVRTDEVIDVIEPA